MSKKKRPFKKKNRSGIGSKHHLREAGYKELKLDPRYTKRNKSKEEDESDRKK